MHPPEYLRAYAQLICYSRNLPLPSKKQQLVHHSRNSTINAMTTAPPLSPMLINALSLIALACQWRPVHGKGGGSKGAAAGGGLNGQYLCFLQTIESVSRISSLLVHWTLERKRVRGSSWKRVLVHLQARFTIPSCVSHAHSAHRPGNRHYIRDSARFATAAGQSDQNSEREREQFDAQRLPFMRAIQFVLIPGR